MLIKTILNKVHKLKSFVYQEVKLAHYQGAEVFNVTIVPRQNGHALCSGCQKPAAGYDHLKERRFEFIPLWGIRVFLLYRMRRVNCKTCGVKVEQVPWAEGKKELTTAYMQFFGILGQKAFLERSGFYFSYIMGKSISGG